MRARAQDVRDDAKPGLLETAGKKEVAMLFSLVLVILPVTIAFCDLPGDLRAATRIVIVRSLS